MPGVPACQPLHSSLPLRTIRFEAPRNLPRCTARQAGQGTRGACRASRCAGRGEAGGGGSRRRGGGGGSGWIPPACQLSASETRSMRALRIGERGNGGRRGDSSGCDEKKKPAASAHMLAHTSVLPEDKGFAVGHCWLGFWNTACDIPSWNSDHRTSRHTVLCPANSAHRVQRSAPQAQHHAMAGEEVAADAALDADVSM